MNKSEENFEKMISRMRYDFDGMYKKIFDILNNELTRKQKIEEFLKKEV